MPEPDSSFLDESTLLEETMSAEGPRDAFAERGQRISGPGMPREIPVRLGKYLVDDVLGRGAMGVVYRARQEGLDRPVALKLLLHGPHATEKQQKRFLREARSIARLRHPNIVTVYEVGDVDGQPFFSMDYIDGLTLDRFSKKIEMSPIVIADMVACIAEAVQYAHDQGIIHRDLKPSNIIVDRHGQPIITDFGLAKEMDEGTMLSVSGDIMGTPAYMAPEQAEGRISLVDEQSDVYSVGAILYALLARRQPFQGKTMVETLNSVIHDYPPPVRTFSPNIDEDLAAICMKAMEKDKRLRYASAGELAEDLRNYMEERPVSAKAWGAGRRIAMWSKRHRLALSAGALAVLLAVVGIVSGLGILNRGYLDVVERQLRSSDAAVRAETVSSLGHEIRQPEALEPADMERAVKLLFGVQADADSSVSGALLEFLAGDYPADIARDISDDFVKWLKAQADDSDPVRRNLALGAIGRLRRPELADYLIGRLKEKNPSLRMRIVRSLGEQRSFKAMGPLINITISDPVCRAEAEAALEKLYRDGRGALSSTQDAAVKSSMRNLQHSISDYNQRLESAVAEMEGRKQKVTGPFSVYEEALSSPDAMKRLQAVYELGRSGDPEALPILIKTLGDDDREVGAAAAMAIAKLKPENTPDELRAGLSDANPSLRHNAALAIGFLRASDHMDDLLVLLAKEPKLEVRRAIVLALGEIGSAEAEAGLSAAMVLDPRLKADVQQALGRIALR